MFRQGDANADAGLKALFGALFPSLMCRLPTGIIFAPVAYDVRVRGVFARTMPITKDGSVPSDRRQAMHAATNPS